MTGGGVPLGDAVICTTSSARSARTAANFVRCFGGRRMHSVPAACGPGPDVVWLLEDAGAADTIPPPRSIIAEASGVQDRVTKFYGEGKVQGADGRRSKSASTSSKSAASLPRILTDSQPRGRIPGPIHATRFRLPRCDTIPASLLGLPWFPSVAPTART